MAFAALRSLEEAPWDVVLTDVRMPGIDGLSLLERIEIPGQILPTPGHSEDSVSLLLDDGSAFTGDLTPMPFIGEEDPAVVSASWQLLRERGATRVYPGHGPVRPIDFYSQ